MKLTCITGVAVLSLVAVPGFAQQDRDRNLGNPNAQPSVQDRTTRSSLQAQPERAFAHPAKVSDILGTEVRNLQNRKVGDVEELALDLETGRVTLAVLSTGGILGIGARSFAVPPASLTYDGAEEVFRIDMDPQRVETAPAFEATRWDDSVSWNNVEEVYRRHGQVVYQARERELVRDREPARTTDGVIAENQPRISARPGVLAKASDVIGMDVVNRPNEEIGEIEDLIVDLPNGRIVYVVVSSGGFLGMGETLSAVPPGAFQASGSRDSVMLDVTKEMLRERTHFNANRWPELSDSNYAAEVYRSYRMEPYFSADGRTRTLDSDRDRDTIPDADNTRRNVRDRDDATLTPLDQGSSDQDIQITRDIRRGILDRDGLSANARNVKIITNNGRVTLRGPVQSEQEKRWIEEVALRSVQREFLDNQIEVERE